MDKAVKVAILGYGVEGQAAMRYWSNLGADITICDTKTNLELPDGIKKQLGVAYLQNLDKFDLLVRSPGVRPDHIESGVPVTSVTKEFMARCPALIIGVTGTKGKGTTSTLITKMLEAAGKTVWLGGNIGTPALDFLDKVKPTDYVVLELSSFQLVDVTQSPQVAVCLMISSDHLDYHGNLEAYADAKANIFRFQKPQDTAIYNGLQPEVVELAELSLGHRVPYGKPEGAYVNGGGIYYKEQKICSISEVGLLGEHNLQNICAAVATTFHLVEATEPLRQAITEFKGLPHRLEEVGVVGGVRYINDSFAANPVSALAALQVFEEPKVAILGGFDRGIDQTVLVEGLKHANLREVILVGQMAPKLAAELQQAGINQFTEATGGMEQIVKQAVGVAKPGDVVLLSPGSPSFDMFKNFADRGNQFKVAVGRLKQK